MTLEEFKLENLGIKKEKFGNIFSFIDFGNVNYWFENDEMDWEDNKIKRGFKLAVDLEKLGVFLKLFSEKSKFYYGLDLKKKASIHLHKKAENIFGRGNAHTKSIQRIKHYLSISDEENNTRSVFRDKRGKFIYIPKCNFDVEISVDAIRLADKYDTFCLLSSDSDFTRLARFLKKQGKNFILIKSGHVAKSLKDIADLMISGQKIKKDICFMKRKFRP
jgi:uncharacterized LabA/DUF88 family protein